MQVKKVNMQYERQHRSRQRPNRCDQLAVCTGGCLIGSCRVKVLLGRHALDANWLRYRPFMTWALNSSRRLSWECACTGAGGPFGPEGGPPQPPSAWQAMLETIGGIMHFFGRLSFLVDENAHAVHFFVTALLQLLDRCRAASHVLRMNTFCLPHTALACRVPWCMITPVGLA